MGRRETGMVKVFGALVLGLVGFAFAATTPAEALDVASVGTAGVTNLTSMVGDALPYITAAIGLGIVLRWARRLFKF